MKRKSINFGSVHIHKKVIADIVCSVINEIDGVSLVSRNICEKFLLLFIKDVFPGILIKVDDKQNVSLTLKVYVYKGVNITDIARQLQESTKSAIEKIANINLGTINIDIQGIDRGGK